MHARTLIIAFLFYIIKNKQKTGIIGEKMNILTVIAIVILLLCGYRGYQKGIIKMLLSFGILIISLWITNYLAPVVANSLCNSKITMEYTTEHVEEQLQIEEKLNIAGLGKRQKKKEVNMMTQIQKEEVSTNLQLPSLLLKEVEKDLSDKIVKENEKIAHAIAQQIDMAIAKMIIKCITYLVIFLVCRIALWILLLITDLLKHIPVVEDYNELLGAGIGLASGVIVLWIGCIILLAFSGTVWGTSCYQAIHDSALLRLIYQNNLLLKYILA